MKIAIISDTHFGYARFEQDAVVQAERAFLDAQEKADLIIYAGDIFDTKIPKLETIHQAVAILQKIRIPVYAIHGNHERRSKEMVNPVMLLAQMDLVRHLHGSGAHFEKDGETLQLFGMGNVPEDFAKVGLEQVLKNFTPSSGAFKVLVLHQSIQELIPQATEEISTEDLEDLPFDLIVNGHIHSYHSLMGGKLLIPGSTVITQLKKEETASKGYLLYDTKTKQHEFVSIHSRPFVFEELSFSQALPSEVRERVAEKVRTLHTAHSQAVIRLVLTGTLRSGSMDGHWGVEVPDLYIDNALENETLRANLERIRQWREEKVGVKEIAIKQLREKTQKITLFDPVEFFDQLSQDSEDGLAYLQSVRPKK